MVNISNAEIKNLYIKAILNLKPVTHVKEVGQGNKG